MEGKLNRRFILAGFQNEILKEDLMSVYNYQVKVMLFTENNINYALIELENDELVKNLWERGLLIHGRDIAFRPYDPYLHDVLLKKVLKVKLSLLKNQIEKIETKIKKEEEKDLPFLLNRINVLKKSIKYPKDPLLDEVRKFQSDFYFIKGEPYFSVKIKKN